MRYIWAMSSDSELIIRRPGPIEFHGETNVTDFDLGHLSRGNLGGIGSATPPTMNAIESKTLSATSPLILGVVGGCIALFGLALDLTIFGLGSWLVIYSIYLYQNNEAIKRLFNSAKRRNSKKWQ